jgi:hypothetical protein
MAASLPMERSMSAKMKVAAAALAVLTLVVGAIATSNSAQASPKWAPAVGIGIATGALIGAAAVSNTGPYGYMGPRCRWVRQYDAYGFYVGTARVCAY